MCASTTSTGSICPHRMRRAKSTAPNRISSVESSIFVWVQGRLRGKARLRSVRPDGQFVSTGLGEMKPLAAGKRENRFHDFSSRFLDLRLHASHELPILAHKEHSNGHLWAGR